MPGPDFEQITRATIVSWLGHRYDADRRYVSNPDYVQPEEVADLVAGLMEQLRQVWNARGAADLYFVTGWSFVPGDCAYVEAETGPDSIAALNAELARRDDGVDASDRPPLSEWKAVQMQRPVCIIHYRD